MKTTAEQQEAKKKERQEKLNLYRGATSKIFYKKVLFFLSLLNLATS